MSRGGFRQGAGRKQNSGPFKEKTVARRIPLSLAEHLDNYCEMIKSGQQVASIGEMLDQFFMVNPSRLTLPFFSSKVPAGLPFEADENIDSYLDLNAHLISKPTTTFFVKVSGDSMILAGINDGDILIVDRSMEARNGSIVIAVVNGELTVKRLRRDIKGCALVPENPDYPILDITPEMNFMIWGVVTSVIHQF